MEIKLLGLASEQNGVWLSFISHHVLEAEPRFHHGRHVNAHVHTLHATNKWRTSYWPVWRVIRCVLEESLEGSSRGRRCIVGACDLGDTFGFVQRTVSATNNSFTFKFSSHLTPHPPTHKCKGLLGILTNYSVYYCCCVSSSEFQENLQSFFFFC